MDESSLLWSEKTFYLISFSYTTGLTIPRLTSPWLVNTRIGILLLLPIQFVLIFIVTVPCIFMELALGQYSSKSLIKIWDLCPMFRGIGYISFVTFMIYQMYNISLMTRYLLFTVLSFGTDDSWKSCDKSWNKINCYTFTSNFTRHYLCKQNYSKKHCDELDWESSLVQFVYYRVLRMGESKNGLPHYEVILFSLVSFIFIFFANFHGVKSVQKFLIILIILPSIQLVILLLFPLLRARGFISLVYLLSENEPNRLKDISIWMSMVKLVSSDCGLGFGGYITLGTTQRFRSPILLRSIAVSLLIFSLTTIYSVTIQNFLTSVMSLHKITKQEIYNVEKENQLGIPEAVFYLPKVARIWVTMWASNMYMLGLRSMTASMLINTEIFYNSFPDLRKYHILVVLVWCCGFFCGVTFFSSKLGYFLLRLIDEVIVDVGLVSINTLKVLAIVYCYGINNFLNDVHFMLGIKLSPSWKLFYVINPILFGSVLVYHLRTYYEGKKKHYNYPFFLYVQHFFLWLNVTVILIYLIYQVGYNIVSKQYKCMEPSQDWGPKDPMLKKSREMFTSHNITKEYLYRQARFGSNRF